MITLSRFALRRGPQLLLSEVDLSLPAGCRIGVVGRNGSGKSSLFAVLQGELEPDQGQIELPGRLRIASVAQETPALADPALDFVISGDAAVWALMCAERAAMQAEEYEAVALAHQQLAEISAYDAPARAGRLLHGLGFPAPTHARPVSEFSGGWRVRLNLARALMTPSDLLLLDEPTNHLDLDAVLWLEQWLLGYGGTLMVISHDREFLDGVCTHTLHLHAGRARLYTGAYTAFEHQRAEQLRLQQLSHEKEQAERERLQRFIDRFRAKASKAAQAQSRMKRLAKLSGTEAVRAERSLSISFDTPPKLPFSLLRLEGVSAGYRQGGNAPADESLPRVAAGTGDGVVLRDVAFGLESGDRVALLGPNGAGKTTLVRTLVGELPVLAGERQAHADLRVGYFAQHTLESLRHGASPIDHLREIAPEATLQAMRSFLGRWYFSGERAFEVVDHFSGGERARLALALIAWRKPNVLLLDEPTNHLDLEMREALAEALAVFEGAIVLVSHDRHLIGLVCDSFWRVADGAVDRFRGDLDEYAAWLRARTAGGTDTAAPAPERPRGGARAARPRSDAGRQRQLQRIEERLAALANERAELEARMADPALYSGQAAGLAPLAGRHAALLEEYARLEAEWLSVSERLEAG